jgi:hypothetical protein
MIAGVPFSFFSFNENLASGVFPLHSLFVFINPTQQIFWANCKTCADVGTYKQNCVYLVLACDKSTDVSLLKDFGISWQTV